MADFGPITWRGKDLSPSVLIDLYRNGADSRARESRSRIELVRQIRRKERRIAVSRKWAQNNPEAALWVGSVLPERNTLERDLIARIGAVEPVYSRQALGFTQRDKDDAESCEAYMEEWRQRSVPVQSFFGKGMEDGEYARVTLPSDLDIDGMPDFFDKLTQRAYASLSPEEQKQYQLDTGDRRVRYVKVDAKGAKQFNPTYDRNAVGQTRTQHEKTGSKLPFTRDHAKSSEAHQEAVRRYLVNRDASTTRLIPALDCVPFFVRGSQRSRWKLAAIVERALYDREELLEAGYGWKGMGDAKLLPRSYGGTRMAGKGGQIYLYTGYLTSTDDEGHERPLICYTVGGAPTWTATAPPDPEEADNALHIVDLYEKMGIEGPLWSYHGGLHTEDDEPDHYYQPYLWPFVEQILTIEGVKTSINQHVATNAAPGYLYTPDAGLAAADPDAVVDSSDTLRRPKVPGTGEIEAAAGGVTPFAAAQLSPDAWRMYQADQESLAKNTAVDQAAGGGDSGHAMVVQASLAQVAKRHIRDGALDATVACGQDHLKILHAIEKTYGVRWPLMTKNERAVGEQLRSGLDVVEFDPAWVGEEGNYLLSAEYPAEENLARIDLEANLAERGFGTFEDVQEARGKSDAMTVRMKVMEDQIWRNPATEQAWMLGIAKARQDKVALQVLKLQQDQQMTKAGVPGMPNGVPRSAISTTTGAGGPTAAQRSRGGQQAAEMGAAANMADAQAAMQVGPQSSPAVAA